MKNIAIVLAVCAGTSGALFGGEKSVNLVKTPGNGIQPQIVIDAKGTVHLLSFQGDPKAGNLMYARRAPSDKRFSAPIKVNSQDGSAIAIGTIRGGHLALGKNGRVHVAWNGTMKAMPKNPLTGSPMLYARLSDDGKSFEPQRNLMTRSAALDGGGTLAADSQENVFVAWHAQGEEQSIGESSRRVWIVTSADDGKTFAAEKRAWDVSTGACACCGMRGFTDLKGNSYFLYRAASEKINRGMYVLQTANQGKSFDGIRLDNWKIDMCPMSSEAIAEGPNGVVGAWDNDGQLFFASLQSKSSAVNAAPGKGGDRKHPALAFNKNGEMLLVWTEGTGWNRGGALAWQMYDKSGQPTATAGRRPSAIAVWGLPAVIAEADGSFTILH